MQQAYKGYFSGLESASLPQEIKAHKEDFEKAFMQMQSLATKLAEYQHAIGKVVAEQKPPATAAATGVGGTGGSTGAADPGAGTSASSGSGAEAAKAGLPAEGGQQVEQVAVQPATAAAGGAARNTSPDRGAGGQAEQEPKTQKEKRAEDCSHDELMQRKPASKLAKTVSEPAAMEVET